MAMNRGEWSELYCILQLILNNKLKIVDAELNVIDTESFLVKEICVEEKHKDITFKVDDCGASIFHNGECFSLLERKNIQFFSKKILRKILAQKADRGAFEILEINDLLKIIGVENKIKAKSGVKNDVLLRNNDLRKQKLIELGYSIKSQLGSPSTILNASNHTNIRYRVSGLKNDDLLVINSINTRTKLLDRLKKIIEIGGKIEYDKMISDSFTYNLELIDSKMPEAIAEAVLNSYIYNEKDLKLLFEKSTVFSDSSISIKKLGDFLSAISFGMMPAKRWNREYEVNGGIFIVSNQGFVYTLDLIYYKNEVSNYLQNETKLDSPSSSRYNMLELFEENGKVFFTLNIQIRYKS